VLSVLEEQDRLVGRLTEVMPGIGLPAALVQRLTTLLNGQDVQLASGDVRPRGFGAYSGQLCLVTHSRVILATARDGSTEDPFEVQMWSRARKQPAARRRPAPPVG
jgi:hypothetical protein